MVNGRRVDIPSYQVRPEDIISIKADSSADRHDPAGDRTGFDRPGLAPGRPRRPHRQGPALPRALRDLGAGPGAAHRRAVLQVVRTYAISEHSIRKELMTTDFQVPSIICREGRRPSRHLHHRAARQGLRLHLRQQPSPRAALLAGRRRDHQRPHRGRRARVLDRPRRQGGRHRHRPQPQGPRRPHAHRCRRGRGAAGGDRPRRDQGQGHRPALGRRDPQPRGADRDAREEDQTRGLPDDRPRPRLLAGRREQVRRAADRRHPDRLDLLADPPRLLRRRRRPRRAADRLRQARRSTSRPTARSSPRRRCARPPRS